MVSFQLLRSLPSGNVAYSSRDVTQVGIGEAHDPLNPDDYVLSTYVGEDRDDSLSIPASAFYDVLPGNFAVGDIALSSRYALIPARLIDSQDVVLFLFSGNERLAYTNIPYPVALLDGEIALRSLFTPDSVIVGYTTATFNNARFNTAIQAYRLPDLAVFSSQENYLGLVRGLLQRKRDKASALLSISDGTDDLNFIASAVSLFEVPVLSQGALVGRVKEISTEENQGVGTSLSITEKGLFQAQGSLLVRLPGTETKAFSGPIVDLKDLNNYLFVLSQNEAQSLVSLLSSVPGLPVMATLDVPGLPYSLSLNDNLLSVSTDAGTFVYSFA